jgi:selenium metabolism protein YedF
MITIDTRGLSGRQPAIETGKAMQAHDRVTAIVDNEAAQRSVIRMATKAGATVQVRSKDDGIYLHISSGPVPQEDESAHQSGPLVLVIPSQFMGRGEHDELGQVLMRGFLHTLGEAQPPPDTIIFLNSGVKLVTQGSPVLEDLQGLQARGVDLLACGTCLDYYELKEQVAAGEISNMPTIVETMLGAGKLIHL